MSMRRVEHGFAGMFGTINKYPMMDADRQVSVDVAVYRQIVG
jgi:hypothetical protein